jgi:hypothetical protein
VLVRQSAFGHGLSLTDADPPTASDGHRPFGPRGGVAVTGHFLSLEQQTEMRRIADVALL